MQQQIQAQIKRMQAKGATYADARWYPFEENQVFSMWNGNLKVNNSSRESGIGIRVLYKGAWGFSASSELGDLDTLFDRALDNARAASQRVTFPVRLAEKDAVQASFTSPCQVNPFEVPVNDKLGFLSVIDASMNQSGVFQRVVDLSFTRKQIVIQDSEGSQIEKMITESFLSLQVIGLDAQGNAHERSFSPRVGNV